MTKRGIIYFKRKNELLAEAMKIDDVREAAERGDAPMDALISAAFINQEALEILRKTTCIVSDIIKQQKGEQHE